MENNPIIVVVGAGAIGSSLAGWISPHHENFYLLARGESAQVIKDHGLESHVKGANEAPAIVSVKVIETLEGIKPTILIITVKNYDLEATARVLHDELDNNEVIVLGLENGVENQQILPKYFSRIVYGIVSYNAWREKPGVIWHDPVGHIIIGTPTNDLGEELQQVASVLNSVHDLDFTITDCLGDAAHCKLVVNLANALLTLVGFQQQPVKNFGRLIKLTLQLFWEGIQLLQTIGYKEHVLAGIPPWKFIKIGKSVPAFLAGALYRANAKKIGLNSMSQDVFGGKLSTELESLNGYALALARQAGFSMPINETIYELAKKNFGPDFHPISEEELWIAIEKKRKMMK